MNHLKQNNHLYIILFIRHNQIDLLNYILYYNIGLFILIILIILFIINK